MNYRLKDRVMVIFAVLHTVKITITYLTPSSVPGEECLYRAEGRLDKHMAIM
jgi:hypothetical protein